MRYDSIIIGAGLGGLVTGALLARSGRRVLVLEQHTVPGGYATSFRRKGEEIEVSLHALGDLGPGGTLPRFLSECGVYPDGVQFVAAPTLYRAEFPDYRITVPQFDLDQYLDQLRQDFGPRAIRLPALFDAFKAIRTELLCLMEQRVAGAPVDFYGSAPTVVKYQNATLGDLLAEYVTCPHLVSVLSQLWVYFGLPPSKVAAVSFAYPWSEYHLYGAHYPVSRSQTLADALVDQIQRHGGEVRLREPVEQIVLGQDGAEGVVLKDGTILHTREVIANANPHTVFHKLVGMDRVPARYRKKLSRGEPGIGCLQFYAILDGDLKQSFGECEHEVFLNEYYDLEQAYDEIQAHRVETAPLVLTFYNNLYEGYCSPGRSVLSVLQLSDARSWTGLTRPEYRQEKERAAAIIRRRLERRYPGITRMIVHSELSTPLTNARYTGNPGGAIYGSEQTVENSSLRRLNHDTPIPNLYLVGAWTQPGGGYSGVIWGGYLLAKRLLRDTLAPMRR